MSSREQARERGQHSTRYRTGSTGLTATRIPLRSPVQPASGHLPRTACSRSVADPPRERPPRGVAGPARVRGGEGERGRAVSVGSDLAGVSETHRRGRRARWARCPRKPPITCRSRRLETSLTSRRRTAFPRFHEPTWLMGSLRVRRDATIERRPRCGRSSTMPMVRRRRRSHSSR